jgi:hypothetical protein
MSQITPSYEEKPHGATSANDLELSLVHPGFRHTAPGITLFLKQSKNMLIFFISAESTGQLKEIPASQREKKWQRGVYMSSYGIIGPKKEFFVSKSLEEFSP